MSWENAPTLNKLTAAQQGGRDIKRGAQIWGVDYKGTLYTNYQKTPGGEWAGWRGPDWAGPGYPRGSTGSPASMSLWAPMSRTPLRW